jgi:hypothetical protein
MAPSIQAQLLPPDASLPVPPASERSVWAPDALHAQTLAELSERAGADRGSPWPVPLASDYARYFRDGDRDAYEAVIWAREQRLSRAAVMAAATLDPRWVDEVADGVSLLCEQSSWSWPAHDDTFAVHGAVVPTVTDPYLDLGAGEVAAQLAWIDHLLGVQLDERVPGVRARIRQEVHRRVFSPFVARRDWHWLGLHGDAHNWCAWIHGNLLVAALRLAGRDRGALVDLAVDGLARYVAAIPADGAIDEGFSYWWQGACRALEALDVLEHATGGALGTDMMAALRESVAFPHRMHLGGPWYVNHADGWARTTGRWWPWHALHRAATRVGDDDARAHAAAHRGPDAPVAHEDQGLGRLLRALTDPDWVTAARAPSPLPRDVWLPSTQVLVARREAGSPAGLALVVKGGHNDEHHNHNDVGSVVVALAGVPVLVDAGRPTYTAQTFGPDRYAIWTMQSSWHNVPEIQGTAQAPGREHAARDVSAHVGDERSGLSLDLAAAYPHGVRRWRRHAALHRADGRVCIREEWELDPGGQGRTRVHLLIAGEVDIGAGRARVTALHGAGSVLLSWTPADAVCTATVKKLDDPMLSEVWADRLTRLEIDVTGAGATGAFELCVEEGQ